MLIFHLYGDAAPTHPIVTIFGMFSGLADVINCAKFQNDRSRGFCSVGAILRHPPNKAKSSLTPCLALTSCT
jgi:hypothetical protein